MRVETTERQMWMPFATGPVRPFFSYYGGKWRDALRYPRPRHDTIVEPFAGSAGYALRYAQRRVVLCDTDPVVVSVWRYLLASTPQEILAIGDVPEGGTVDDLPVCQEARWLVGFWLNKGASSPRRSPSSWMRSGVRPGSFWGPRIRTTIAAQVDRIRHWKVYEVSYEDCPHQGPATWFVDPPYIGAGQHYRHGSDGIDYGRLAAWCKIRAGQAIVCENAGASWLPFEPLASVKTARAGRRSAEAVWLQ